jgi:hypothetical protein
MQNREIILFFSEDFRMRGKWNITFLLACYEQAHFTLDGDFDCLNGTSNVLAQVV